LTFSPPVGLRDHGQGIYPRNQNCNPSVIGGLGSRLRKNDGDN